MIGSKVGIAIKYTQFVSTLLVNRANYLRRKMKTLSGGDPSAGGSRGCDAHANSASRGEG